MTCTCGSHHTSIGPCTLELEFFAILLSSPKERVHATHVHEKVWSSCIADVSFVCQEIEA